MNDARRRGEDAENCGACIFWAKNQWFNAGECRRHSPGRVESPMGKQLDGAAWPQTGESDWCGEFQPASPIPERG